MLDPERLLREIGPGQYGKYFVTLDLNADRALEVELRALFGRKICDIQIIKIVATITPDTVAAFRNPEGWVKLEYHCIVNNFPDLRIATVMTPAGYIIGLIPEDEDLLPPEEYMLDEEDDL